MQGLAIMVFISDNEASQHAVNLAVALARQEVDSVHVMHACTNEGSTPDAQKLMARCTQGLGPKINSEVMVRQCLPTHLTSTSRRQLHWICACCCSPAMAACWSYAVMPSRQMDLALTSAQYAAAEHREEKTVVLSA